MQTLRATVTTTSDPTACELFHKLCQHYDLHDGAVDPDQAGLPESLTLSAGDEHFALTVRAAGTEWYIHPEPAAAWLHLLHLLDIQPGPDLETITLHATPTIAHLDLHLHNDDRDRHPVDLRTLADRL